MDSANIQLRDARDRLTELLELGEPYPLRDLPVRDEQLTVTFDISAKIPIDLSQRGVLYQLYYDGKPVTRTKDNRAGAGDPIEAEGTGDTIYLETYKIQEDITFDIYAVKQQTRRAATLHHTATVKVGLDTALKAWIRDLPHLDPAIEDPTDTNPRIVAYGALVSVEIENSQEGVDYRLVYLDGSKEIDFTTTGAKGDLHNIVLQSQAVQEDIVFRVRATKVFDASEKRPTQTALLNVELPLKVRANPALAVSVKPTQIIGYNEASSITLANTQKSTNYQVFLHLVRDEEFVYQNLPDDVVSKVSVPDEADVRVLNGTESDVWTDPAGYIPIGDPVLGNGSDLTFDLSSMTDDFILLIKASKDHQVGDQIVPSAVPLQQSPLILVQPNATPPLRVRLVIDGAKSVNAMTLFEGQPGVFYSFRAPSKRKDVGLPGYFHKRDADDPSLNKGLNQLRIGVDYVIARSYPIPEGVVPAQVPPPPPLLDTDPIPFDTTLRVQATKAQTRVSVALTQGLSIPALPDIHLQDSTVDYNQATKILVIASVEGDKYQPLLNGNPLIRPLNGNGKDLSFNTDPLVSDTDFEVLVTRSGTDITAERIVRLRALVRPDASLAVTLLNDPVVPNTAAQIQIDASQVGVSYQLTIANKPVGAAIEGNGTSIVLQSGVLSSDTTFVIRATKVNQANVFADLAQPITAKLAVPGGDADPVSP